MVVRGIGLALVMIALLVIRPCSADDQTLRMNLVPTSAVLTVLEMYHPMGRQLEQSLGRPVGLFVARTFRAYYDDVVAEDYEIIVTAPHFGVIALDHGYVPLFRYTPDLQSLIVVARGRGITSPAQLKARRVLTADRLTAVSVIAERWLEVDFGLRVGRDYELAEAANHTAAIRAVALGVADAAITTPPALVQVPAEVRDAIDVLPSRLTMPQMFLMAHRRLGADTIERIRAALAAFPHTDPGKAFFAKGYGGFVALTQADMETARPYADIVTRRIRAGE